MKYIYIYIALIICHALTDEIDHRKGNRTLFDLWHLLRDVFVVLVFFFARTIDLSCPWWVYVIMAVLGWALWETVYRIATNVKFHNLDDKFSFGLPFEILGFGKQSGLKFWQWILIKFGR